MHTYSQKVFGRAVNKGARSVRLYCCENQLNGCEVRNVENDTSFIINSNSII